MTSRSILWQHLDHPGHDACRLVIEERRIFLAGCATFDADGHQATLAYRILCDPAWHTHTVLITGWIDLLPVTHVIQSDPLRWWSMNALATPAVNGSLDIDLGFTPATNLLPIRRLGLQIGEEAEVRAAWLSFPEMTLQPLDQLYRRTGPDTYHYESDGGAFTRELTVDGDGFVVEYPGLWRRADRP